MKYEIKRFSVNQDDQGGLKNRILKKAVDSIPFEDIGGKAGSIGKDMHLGNKINKRIQKISKKANLGDQASSELLKKIKNNPKRYESLAEKLSKRKLGRITKIGEGLGATAALGISAYEEYKDHKNPD